MTQNFNNTTVSNALYSTATGTASSNPMVFEYQPRDPGVNDVAYPIQKIWLNTTTNEYWSLKNYNSIGTGGIVQANWITLGGNEAAVLETLTGNDSIAVPPTNHNINVVGDGVFITTTGDAATSTLTISAIAAANVKFTVDEDTAPGTNPVVPDLSGNVTITGGQVPASTTANCIQTNSLAANEFTIQIQISDESATSNPAINGVCHFDNTKFIVDGNGFVTTNGQIATLYIEDTGRATPSSNILNINGTGGITTSGTGNSVTINGFGLVSKVEVDANTAPGTNPVLPSSAGQISVSGGQVPAGTTSSVIQTNSLAANTYDIQIQRSQAVASSTVADNGVSHFDSSSFGVDSNGFVTLLSDIGSIVVNIQTFTTSGTYTPTANMQYCIIQILGGGGGGGGAVATVGNQFAGGAGGGGGEYATGVFSAATVGVSQTVTIGGGGAGNVAGNGSDGGTSLVGSLISCLGGSGGETAVFTSSFGIVAGGDGGTGGAGGNYRTPGQCGGYFATGSGSGLAIPGTGANSQLGAGGNIAVQFAGLPGLGYGAGGGGTANGPSFVTSLAGGAGTAGIVVITEYIS